MPTAPRADKGAFEIRTESKSLNNAGWVDESRGIVRLPIDRHPDCRAGMAESRAARADLIRARQKKPRARAGCCAQTERI
jgi:hypothetical protein